MLLESKQIGDVACYSLGRHLFHNVKSAKLAASASRAEFHIFSRAESTGPLPM